MRLGAASGRAGWLPADSLGRIAVMSAILFLGLGLISDLLFVAAFQFRVDWFVDPALAVAGGPATSALLRWGALTDMLSYYLPMAPIALALRDRLRGRDPAVADLATLAALGYVIAGGVAAVSLAWAGPLLVDAYTGGVPDRTATAADFRLLVDVVFRAIWQTLDGILLAAWFLGLWHLAQRVDRRFALLSLALGVLALAGVTANVLGVGLVRDLILGLVFVLWFAWGVVVVALLRTARSAF
jgi:hypothetical protein